MKDFVKYTLATLCGLFLAGIATFVLATIAIIGMLSVDNGTTPIQPRSMLRLTLNGILQEDAPEDPFGTLFGNTYPVLSQKNILAAIQAAKTNPDISGIYIEAQALSGATPAMLQEIRESLADFKESGKPVIAYGDYYTQGCYYICSVADKIVLNPQGQVTWCGMASQPIFYKDLLEKIGIKMQVFKVGSYKSAVEPFTRKKVSSAPNTSAACLCASSRTPSGRCRSSKPSISVISSRAAEPSTGPASSGIFLLWPGIWKG